MQRYLIGPYRHVTGNVQDASKASNYLCHSVRLIWIRKKPIQKTDTDQVYVAYSAVLGGPL